MVNKVLNALMGYYPDETVDVRDPDGGEIHTHGSRRQLEGLPGVLIQPIVNLIDYLQRPKDPLNPQQVRCILGIEKLSLNVEVQPDKASRERGTRPSILYVRYRERDVGTAYGSRFVPSSPEVMEDRATRNLVEAITENCYN